MTTKRIEKRNAKDPAAWLAKINEAGHTLGWGGFRYSVALVSIDGVTKTGRVRFTVEITQTDERA